MAMAGADWVGSEIKKLVPGAIVEVSDLHGTGDHFHVRVISDSFDGMLPLERQRPILDFFMPHIKSGVVHALDLKCMTEEQAKAAATLYSTLMARAKNNSWAFISEDQRRNKYDRI